MVSKSSVIPCYIETELIAAKQHPPQQRRQNLNISYFSTERLVFEKCMVSSYFLAQLLGSFLERTLKSAPLWNTDIARPNFFHSGLPPTLKTVQWVYIFTFSINRPITSAQLRQIASNNQFETSPFY